MSKKCRSVNCKNRDNEGIFVGQYCTSCHNVRELKKAAKLRYAVERIKNKLAAKILTCNDIMTLHHIDKIFNRKMVAVVKYKKGADKNENKNNI